MLLPFQLDPNTSDQGHYFQVVARLKPGVSLEQAKARLQASAGEYRAKFPSGLGPKDGFSVAAYREAVVGDLYGRYMSRPHDLPWRDVAADEPARARQIADFIAGMTDRFALEEHARLFDSTPELR